MSAVSNPVWNIEFPEHMSAMIVDLDIDLKRLSHHWHNTLMRQAARRCDACTEKIRCQAWLGGEGTSTGCPDYCPIAGVLDRFANYSKSPDLTVH
jgi:hypothetical protein